MKEVLILGSTGSIGENALSVISRFPEKFKVKALVAGKNVRKLKEQALKFKPTAVCLVESNEEFSFDGKFYKGLDGLKELIEEVDFDVCISAITGASGILPTYWASLKGKRIALANKESLVCAGQFIVEVAKEIIPVDSEHSALFQCLVKEKKENVKELILTASGGPFRDREDLENVTPSEALKHPNWSMGQKVTIDSATLMNKGLEVIEAYWLFGIPLEKIKVVIHPQSIVHSLVKFIDNSCLAQLGVPDMKIPIAYALSYPERLPLDIPQLNLDLKGELTFFEPDLKKFPSLKLAYESLKLGYPYPIVLNAADEVAVSLFLNGKIKFTDIPRLIEKTLEKSNFSKPISVEEVVKIDQEAKRLALELSKEFTS
ncbi:MAG: 1-deoxy-D-xylulose-5-phosphate reductoisomerase [Desulfurobacteriaceae bacterium]